MLYQKKQLQGIRRRFKEGKLTEQDQKVIDDLLEGAAEMAATPTTGGGKRVVTRLPYGMDVVK
jgi:hypothetical protein